jgi:hypothetical protein
MEFLVASFLIGLVLGAMFQYRGYHIYLRYRSMKRTEHDEGIRFQNCDHCQVRERFRGQYSHAGHIGGALLCESCMTTWQNKTPKRFVDYHP